MSLATCAVTGNIQNLLGSNVNTASISVSVPVPFFAGEVFVSGEIASVTTDSDGNFSISVIQTVDYGQRLNFTIQFFDGVSAFRTKQYSVVVPDLSTATLADLVAQQTSVVFTPTFPAQNVTVSPQIPGIVADDVYDALAALANSSSSITIGALDSQTPSVNGAAALAGTLYLQSASGTRPGLINNTTQALSGDKTLSGTLLANNLAGTNTGDASINVSNGLTITGQALSLGLASTFTNGALSSTDWATFNGKQDAITVGNLTDTGTDGIIVTSGTGAVVGSGTSIAQHVADSTHNGYLASADWTTFNAKQSPLTIGNITDIGTDGITITGGTGAIIGSSVTVAQHVADVSHNGYLTSSDWSTFNSKQAAVSFAAVGSSPSANGGGISGGVITLQPADGSNPGLVTSGTQTLGGNKTFSGDVIVSTLNASTPGTSVDPGIFVIPSGSNKFGIGLGTASKPGIVGFGGFEFLIFNTGNGTAEFASTVRTNAQFPGGVNTPSFIIGTDSDTGFYYLGSGSWGFTSNATQVLGIDSSGLRIVSGQINGIDDTSGGNVNVTAGNGTLSSAAGGSSSIAGGTVSGSASTAATILAGGAQGSGSPQGGPITITAGNGDSGVVGGTVVIQAGGGDAGVSNPGALTLNPGAVSGAGGGIDIISGDGASNVSGDINITVGQGDAGFRGGTLTMSAGLGNGGTSNPAVFQAQSGDDSGNGGIVAIVGGDAAGGSNANGGNIILRAGALDGSGQVGEVMCQSHLNASQNGNVSSVAAQAAAGTGANASLSGNASDTAGTLSLTMGTLSITTGAQVVVTFSAPYSDVPVIVLTPTTATTSANLVHAYVTSTTNDFTINFGVSGVGATTYSWNYVAIGSVA